MLKTHNNTALLLVFASLLSSQAIGSEPTSTKKEVERIEVQGVKPKSLYRSEYRQFREDFVNSFNRLVDDPDMRVVCEYHSPTGTRIKKRQCQPRFIKTITARETQRELSMGRNFTDAANVQLRQDIQKDIIKQYEAFKALTDSLLLENADLASKYEKMETALTNYENYGEMHN